LKRIGYLYEKIYDYENLKLAHKNAQKSKRYYRDVIKVNENEEYYLLELQNQLKNKTFKNGKYHIFKKIDKGKEREIYSLPYFPDRILHHAILQILEPIWKKILIKDTYQSIKGRGIHEGFRRVKKSIQSNNNFSCLKIDVKKFYPSINNEILKQIIRKKIKDPNVLWLLDTIIDSTKGVPIGNYLSQFFGNLFLTYFDHWMKEIKKIKNYFRYCDDIVILHQDKQFLQKLLKEMIDYLNNNLELSLKRNYQIFSINKRRLDFLGFKFDHRKIYIRRNIALNFKRKICSVIKNSNQSFLRNGVMSYYGWVKTSKSYNLWNKYFTKEIELLF
jgi:RNA-directed DNA polymerase